MQRMNIQAAFVLSVLSAVTCDPSGPPMMLIFPSDSPKPVSPTEEPGKEVLTRIQPKDERGFVELPEWMDVDLNKVALDKLSLLSSANNLAELATLFGITKDQEDKLESEWKVDESPGIFGLRGGSSNVIAQEAESGTCKPSLELIDLEAPPGNVYQPKCVRLMRCGGCCGTDLLSCHPTKSEAVKIKVLNVSKSVRSRRGARAKYTTVNQVNHTACSCLCTTKERDCEKNIHDYNPDECACVCKNRGEEASCSAKKTHHWDRRDCSCRCITKKQCSTGEDFSQDICRCIRKVIFGEGSRN